MGHYQNIRGRAEHIEWCKSRALVYLDRGQASHAFVSMVNDLTKHPEVQVSSLLHVDGITAAMADDSDAMRCWIGSFQ